MNRQPAKTNPKLLAIKSRQRMEAARKKWEVLEGVDNPLMPTFLKDFMIEKHEGALTAIDGLR